MRRARLSIHYWLTALLVSFAPAWGADTEQDGHLSATEREQLIDVLQRSYAEFRGLVSELGDEAWRYEPAADRWSVGEVAEHLVLAEEILFGVATQVLESEPSPAWRHADETGIEDVIRLASDRSRKFQANERVVPTAEWSREEVMSRFAAARRKTMELVREVDTPVKRHTAPNPLVEEASFKHWIAFIAGHNFRHNKQIAEVIRSMD